MGRVGTRRPDHEGDERHRRARARWARAPPRSRPACRSSITCCEQLGKHAGWDLSVTCTGDLEVDGHHTVEDVGLAIGQALAEALGDKAGIRRFASIVVPLDEAAVEVALDLSGRNFVIHEVDVPAETIGTFDTGLVEDFVRALAQAADLTVHVRLRSGRSPHHVVEAEFKALAKALGDACALTGPGDVPSTKGTL